MDNYFLRPEVSNSGLTQLEKYFEPQAPWLDIEEAYRLGTLVDCVITEPERVNYYTRKVEQYHYSGEEMEMAKRMKDSFLRHPFCRDLYENSEMQHVVVTKLQIQYCDHRFVLPVKKKDDFFPRHLDLIADLKSTACTTQKQFEECVKHFRYDRQAAFYMDIDKRNNFAFLGISKKPPYSVFIVPVKRGDKLYNSGLASYQELAFKYWCLFS